MGSSPRPTFRRFFPSLPTTQTWNVAEIIRSRFPERVDSDRQAEKLYEAALEGLIPLIYTQWRIWKTPVLASQPGRLAGEFLLVYALGRIVAEQFREPDAGIALLWGLSRGSPSPARRAGPEKTGDPTERCSNPRNGRSSPVSTPTVYGAACPCKPIRQ